MGVKDKYRIVKICVKNSVFVVLTCAHLNLACRRLHMLQLFLQKVSDRVDIKSLDMCAAKTFYTDYLQNICIT